MDSKLPEPPWWVSQLTNTPRFHERLIKGAGYYHDGSSDECLYGEYIQRSRDWHESVGGFVLEFLEKWGSLARTFPRQGVPGLKAQIDQWFIDHLVVITRLSTESLWSVNLREIGIEVCQLFDSLKRLPQSGANGRKRTFGSTAAGKALHLFLPELCVIWDDKIVRRSMGLGDDAWSYLRYLQAQKRILERAIHDVCEEVHCDPTTAVRWIEQTHRIQRDHVAQLNFDEPATKILDEAMYDSEFAIREVKPLLEKG